MGCAHGPLSLPTFHDVFSSAGARIGIGAKLAGLQAPVLPKPAAAGRVAGRGLARRGLFAGSRAGRPGAFWAGRADGPLLHRRGAGGRGAGLLFRMARLPTAAGPCADERRRGRPADRRLLSGRGR